jgi:heme/copper-type cytochrome/quinol oxidase subunit 2
VSGFGGLSLYGLWAAYGAAPTPMGLLGFGATHGEGPGKAEAAPSAHAGHGGGAESSAGSASEEFSRLTTEFVERFKLPDGTVYPRRLPATELPPADPHAGHDMAAMADPHAGHDMAAMADPHAGHDMAAMDDASAGPMDVLMMAGKWYYAPSALRLHANQAYRFRIMAMDTIHGASIQFGHGAKMMRLQPGRVAETRLTFTRPGRYLMHCTVYCGDAHDFMQATLEVV